MLALVLAGIVAQAPVASTRDEPLRFRLGIDATEVLAPERPLPFIEPRLLERAPTSGSVALLSSGLSVGAGFAMMLGFTTHALLLQPSQLTPLIVGNAVGFLLLNFGPNLGDLLNGDLGRFALRGLLRTLLALAAPLSIILGPVAPLAFVAVGSAWLGWIVRDTWESRNAPSRWAQRRPTGTAAPPGY